MHETHTHTHTTGENGLGETGQEFRFLKDLRCAKEGEANDGQECGGKRSKTWFRTATKSFMRRNKAADRWLERKIWPPYLAVRRKLTAKRESETKRGKQARCPKQQLLWNKRHIRAKYPETQKPELVTPNFTSTAAPRACKRRSYSLKAFHT